MYSFVLDTHNSYTLTVRFYRTCLTIANCNLLFRLSSDAISFMFKDGHSVQTGSFRSDQADPVQAQARSAVYGFP